jgi:putative inorganic carbon (hco3(-)) transporter
MMKLYPLPLPPRNAAILWNTTEIAVLVAVFFLPFSKSLAEIGVITAASIWALRLLLHDHQLPIVTPATYSYVAFVFLAPMSFIHIQPELFPYAGHGFFKWIKYFGLFFAVFELYRDGSRHKRLIMIFMFSMFLVCLNGFYQMVNGVDLIKHYSVDIPGRFMRMQSSFSAPNGLAAFGLVGIPIVLHLWIKEKVWNRKSIVWALLFAILGVSFVATYSRAAFLALFLSFAIFVIARRGLRFVPVIFAVPLLFLFGSEKLRYNFFTSLNLQDITVGERLEFWKVSWSIIQDHPFVGHGLNTYYQLLTQYAPANLSYRGYAHNCYIQMWVEIGLLGLVAFLVPMIYVFWKEIIVGWKKLRGFALRDALFVGLMAFSIQAFFDTHFYSLQTATLFWIFWGLYFALRSRLR